MTIKQVPPQEFYQYFATLALIAESNTCLPDPCIHGLSDDCQDLYHFRTFVENVTSFKYGTPAQHNASIIHTLTQFKSILLTNFEASSLSSSSSSLPLPADKKQQEW